MSRSPGPGSTAARSRSARPETAPRIQPNYPATEDDRKVAVDSRRRVHGIAALRVADASVMPTITSGNIGAPAPMSAERAAERITAAPG